MKLASLNENRDILSTQAYLTAAAAIRDNVSGDEDVERQCQGDAQACAERNSLLTDINSIIAERVDLASAPAAEARKDVTVREPAAAKAALLSLVEAEKPVESGLAEARSAAAGHAKTLGAMRERLTRPCNVLLMSEFQSGKTTTLNAMCDGRRVGAVGAGEATSAVPVAVTYGERESVAVRWATKEDLMPILGHMSGYVDGFRAEAFDLDNAGQRLKWGDGLEKLRGSKKCPNVGDETKYLAICSMLLRFWGTAALAREQERVTDIEHVPDITKFADRFSIRWKKKGAEDFTLRESLFAFMVQVDVTCPSPILKYLNATVVDCPGLFSSSYDTEVTKSAMLRADAILYVLPYDRGIGESINKSLIEIRDNYPDMHRKLFIVNNSDESANKKFFESNCAWIEDNFPGKGASMLKYDACYSLLGQQRVAYEAGRLPEPDVCRFMEKKPRRRFGKAMQQETPGKKEYYGTFAEAWDEHASCYGVTCGDVTAAETVEEGGLTAVVEELARFVTTNAAHVTILTGGLHPMWREMSGLRDTLVKRYVEPYRIGCDNTKKLWTTRLERAEEFAETAKTQTRQCFYGKGAAGNTMRDDLVQQVADKLFTTDFYRELARDIAGYLYDDLSIPWPHPFRSDAEKEAAKKAEEKAREKIIMGRTLAAYQKQMEYWLLLLSTGQDATYNSVFTPKVENLTMKLEQEWNKLYNDDNDFPMQQYLYIPKTTKEYFEKAKEHDDPNVKLDGGKTDDGIALMISALGGTTALGTFLGTYIVAIFYDPTGFLIAFAGIVGLALAGYSWIIGENVAKKWFVNHNYEKIEKALKDNDLHSAFRKTVGKTTDDLLQGFSSLLSIDMRKMNLDSAAATAGEDVESRCFMAVEAVEAVDSRIAQYAAFEREHTVTEADA